MVLYHLKRQNIPLKLHAVDAALYDHLGTRPLCL